MSIEHIDERTERTPEEEAALIVARKRAEAEAEQADERARITTIGGAALGAVGVVVCLVGLLWKDSVSIGLTGALIAGVAFGLITMAQALKAAGKS